MRGSAKMLLDAAHPIAHGTGFASPGAAPAAPLAPPRRSRIGLIYNPRSAGNRGRRPLRAVDVPCSIPETRADLVTALRDFARREVGTVAVSGGDGTVRDVLSALPHAYNGSPHPAVAILPAGRTDLIASEVGSHARDDELARLLAATRGGWLRITTLPVLRVGPVVDPDGRLVTVRGMLLGAAGFTFATRLGQKIFDSGQSHSKGVAITFATVFRRVILQGDPDDLRAGERMSLSVDGRPDESGGDARRALLMASTLRKPIVVGRSPFFGEYREDQLRYLDVSGPARGVPRAVASLLIRRPELAGTGWGSGAATTLDLGLTGSLVVDGEIFDPPPGGRVRISADPAVRFVAP